MFIDYLVILFFFTIRHFLCANIQRKFRLRQTKIKENAFFKKKVSVFSHNCIFFTIFALETTKCVRKHINHSEEQWHKRYE